jgi:hypothetical protein
MTAARDITKVKTEKRIVLSSSPDDSGCYSLEIKHDKRKAPRTKLLVSDKRLQKQRLQPQQTDLSLIPDKDDFCRSESKHDRRTTPRLNVFVLANKL